MALDCLKDIIGLTRSECACAVNNLGDQPEENWYKKSESGLFLDELPGIVGIKGVEESSECEGQLATWYQNSIETAKMQMQDDVIVGLTQRFRQAQKTYIGKAAGTVYSMNENFVSAFAGVQFATRSLRGGKLKIKKIYAMFAVPPTEFVVYRRDYLTQVLEFVQDIVITPITPNAVHAISLETPLQLNLDSYEYFLMYDAAGISAKNNSTSCGCGSTETLLKKYTEIVGVTGSDLADFGTWSRSNTAHGLAFDIEIGCTADNILCQLFESDMAYQRVMAYTVQFKAGELVMEKVANSGEINRYTMTGNEYLWGKRNHFRKEYIDRINWMVEKVDIGSFTDCYVCDQVHKKINKTGLLV